MSEVVNEEIHQECLDGGRPSLDGDPDPHFEPVITLPEVKIPTLEEEETVLFRVRAKLFRHDKINKEWKERGTGEAKLLFHEIKNTVRIIMRRDKTLKLCANHYVTPEMILEPKSGTDRVWLWTTNADMSDGIPKAEILAMRFMNPEAANNWLSAFQEAKARIPLNSFKVIDDSDEKDEGVSSSQASSEDEDEDEVAEKVRSMSIKEDQNGSNVIENNDKNCTKKE